MYYSIYDNQLDKIRAFAENLSSKEEVRKNLINFLLLGNFSVEGENSIKRNSLEQLCNYYEFTLIESEEKIPSDYELAL
jgi:hypothetical protein